MLLVLFQVKNVKLDCKISAKVSTVSKKVDHIVQSYLKLFHSYLFQTSEIVILEDSFSSSIFMVHENQKVCFIDFFSFICFHLHVILNFVFFSYWNFIYISYTCTFHELFWCELCMLFTNLISTQFRYLLKWYFLSNPNWQEVISYYFKA